MTDEEKRIEGLVLGLIGARYVLESEFYWTGKHHAPFNIETKRYKDRKQELVEAALGDHMKGINDE